MAFYLNARSNSQRLVQRFQETLVTASVVGDKFDPASVQLASQASRGDSLSSIILQQNFNRSSRLDRQTIVLSEHATTSGKKVDLLMRMPVLDKYSI